MRSRFEAEVGGRGHASRHDRSASSPTVAARGRKGRLWVASPRAFSRAALVSAALSSGLLGCDEVAEQLAGDDGERATSAVASLDLTILEASLFAALVEDLPATGTAQDLATRIAANVEARFSPAACRLSAVADRTVTLTLDGCGGPRGLTGVRGIAVAALFGDAVDGPTVNLTATGIQVGTSTMTLNANGAYAIEQGRQTLSLQTTGGGTDAAGTFIGRVGTYVATFDDACLEVNGQWVTSVGEVGWGTGARAVRWCPPRCPESGQMAFGGVDTAETNDLFETGVVLTFTGLPTVPYLSTNGTPGVVTLDCGG